MRSVPPTKGSHKRSLSLSSLKKRWKDMNELRVLKGLILAFGIPAFSSRGECYDIAARLKARILPSEAKDLSRERGTGYSVLSRPSEKVSLWLGLFAFDHQVRSSLLLSATWKRESRFVWHWPQDKPFSAS